LLHTATSERFRDRHYKALYKLTFVTFLLLSRWSVAMLDTLVSLNMFCVILCVCGAGVIEDKNDSRETMHFIATQSYCYFALASVCDNRTLGRWEESRRGRRMSPLGGWRDAADWWRGQAGGSVPAASSATAPVRRATTATTAARPATTSPGPWGRTTPTTTTTTSWRRLLFFDAVAAAAAAASGKAAVRTACPASTSTATATDRRATSSSARLLLRPLQRTGHRGLPATPPDHELWSSGAVGKRTTLWLHSQTDITADKTHHQSIYKRKQSTY